MRLKVGDPNVMAIGQGVKQFVLSSVTRECVSFPIAAPPGRLAVVRNEPPGFPRRSDQLGTRFVFFRLVNISGIATINGDESTHGRKTDA